MSNKARSSLFRYRLILRLLAPALLCLNAWQAFNAHDMRLFLQRMGRCLPQRKDRPLWLHAASVGELIAAQPLIMALRDRFPQLPMMVTTTTPTGAKLAAERVPAEVQHLYFPVDWPGATKRFLQAAQPRAVLVMETELWPNLYACLAQDNIPLVIINGRLSARTLNTRPWIRSLYTECLKSVTIVLARSEQDANAYIQLGASSDRVQTLGNIKFAQMPERKSIVPVALGRPYILAASTHEDEERQLAAIWKQLVQGDCLLVIAPRHPGRCGRILQQLQPLSLNIAVRSRGDVIAESTDIYLADTLGELEAFMAGALLVFMGGSMVAKGGHNILEPARLGRAILFGSYMDNFREESELLLAEDAALSVSDEAQLRVALQAALSNPESVAHLGSNARRVLQANGDVLVRYLDAIAGYCNLPGSG